MSSRQDAKQAVLNIHKEIYGAVREVSLNRMEEWDPEVRQEVEEAMLIKGHRIGHNIITLAKTIYSSKARFVFELLQNADDSRFERAQASGALPSIEFHVHPGRIIAECNEDGFTKRDLSAICATGQSTKSGSHGYIGAKGIGFKSVFIAAWKVHIQSGHFSFYFKHRKGDSGMGMVLPIWVDGDEGSDSAQESTPSPGTRMTLHLIDKGDAKELEHLHETIFNQLADLQPTCLLFLRNLKRVQVTFYSEDGRITSSRAFHHIGGADGDNSHRVVLESTIMDQDGEVTATETNHFHVTRHIAANLSRSQNCEQRSEAEEGSRAFSTAEVVLAFPLTASSAPITKKQEIFSFLSVEESVFNFIIQSDFDTAAGRQSIETTSKRNIDLLDGIAAAFLKAVLQFCEHENLCYTWPLFLPADTDKPGQFWSGLHSRIKQLLAETPVLKSRHVPNLRSIRDVFIPGSDAIDTHGEPLLDCPVRDPWLSTRYAFQSRASLGSYGLGIGCLVLLVDLLRSDLRKDSGSSKMKAKSTSEAWHSATAKLFSGCFEGKFHAMISALKRLPLLPLASGAWVSANSGVTCMPTTIGGIPVPQGMDDHLRVLDSSAVNNRDRSDFFRHLGAVEASVSLVRSAVLKAYSPSGRPLVGVAVSKAQLRFLYLAYSQEQSPSDLKDLYVYLHNGDIAYPHRQDVYLPGDHAYGPEALLEPGGDAPGLQVAFLHPAYLEDVPAISESRQSWREWLLEHLGVRDRLRIVARNIDKLSDVWHYVAQHRPERLLGLLEHAWPHDGPLICSSNKLTTALSETDATDLCSASFPRDDGDFIALQQTWLPLSDLQQERLRFMAASDPFPFLRLEEADAASSTEQLTAKFLFLEQLGVGFRAGDKIDFLLEVLLYMRPADGRPVLDLYCTIEAALLGLNQADQQQAIVKIRKSLCDDYDLILIDDESGEDDDGLDWSDNYGLLWKGPPGMTTKSTVERLYTRLCGDDSTKLDLVSGFFKRTLGIQNASIDDILQELESLQEDGCDDLDGISGLYRYLSEIGETSTHSIRSAFQSKYLIFASKGGRNGWYKTSQCLWSSTADIQGIVTLKDLYQGLDDFFLKVLGVETLTIQMVYDELKKTTTECPVEKVKNTIETFNSFLRGAGRSRQSLDPEPLLQAAFLPVRYPDGSVALRSAVKEEFAIVDRQSLGELFRGSIKLLDYSLEDVRRLAPLFRWAGLEHRYLSRSVRETTSASGGVARPTEMPSRRLQSEPHAVLRIAATYSSPRYEANKEGVYQLLRSAQVLEADGISTVLSISQDGHCTRVERVSGDDVHIDETSSSGGGQPLLRILVPSNKEKQEICYSWALPRALGAWLMRDPTTHIQDEAKDGAVMALAAILNASGAEAVVDGILERHGIIQVPVPTVIEPPDDEEAEMRRIARTPLSASPSPSWKPTVITPDRSSSAPDSNYSGGLSTGISTAATPSSSYSSPTPQRPPVWRIDDEETRRYITLLDGVLKAARMASFPSTGAFAMDKIRAALPSVDAGDFDSLNGFDRGGFQLGTGIRSSTRLERDKKIGAAGELYVFELLSRLSDPALSGWSRDNWQSTIRKYVAVHPNYADMRPWSGVETADLTYDDTEGNLTALLVDHGWLADEEAWRGATPRYFIEVKSTTEPCDVPFYMSKGQYQRMKHIHERADRREIYMILRVFDIGGSGTGMRVYVDPEQLRMDDALAFTAETWSVVPGPSM